MIKLLCLKVVLEVFTFLSVLLLQRVHSLRAYRQALDVYQGKGWALAEDYAHFCLAKHSFSIHNLSEALASFHQLLSHESAQSPSLQRLHLQDYIYVYKVKGLHGTWVLLPVVCRRHVSDKGHCVVIVVR